MNRVIDNCTPRQEDSPLFTHGEDLLKAASDLVVALRVLHVNEWFPKMLELERIIEEIRAESSR